MSGDHPTVLVMAAGEGTRMRSSVPKVLHSVCGRPMVAWPVLAAKAAGAGTVAVIVSPNQEIDAALPEGTETVVQPEPDGTGGAVRAALELVQGAGTVLVLPGDHVLISGEALTRLIETHREAGAAATLVTTEMEDPGSYGRIVRDEAGDVERIIETKNSGDATPDQLAIKEVSAAIFAFDGPALADALAKIGNDNAQGEYYLGDVLPVMRSAGLRVAAHRETGTHINLGINTRADLAYVESEARALINNGHMLAGVTITDPRSCWIDADVAISADVTIEPGTTLRGATEIGPGSVVGPHTTLIDTRLGERVNVPHSYLIECEVLNGCEVGPFAFIRPQTTLREGAKAGAFVEIKNSRIGEGTKVPHLSYVGDAEIGRGSNIGAGSITANYDGFRKHRTVIGDHCRIGVDTMFVAPIHIGDDAYTGAGSVIKDDVPDGALAVSQNEQRNIEGFAEQKAEESEQGS